MLGIAGDELAQLRPVPIHGQRKHRPAGDFEGEELHLGEEVDRAPAAIRELDRSKHRSACAMWRASIGIVRGVNAGATVCR